MNTTGSSLSIASRSIEYASAGFDGITTVRPGVEVQYASDESEWCSTPPIAPAHGMRTTIGSVIRPFVRFRIFATCETICSNAG